MMDEGAVPDNGEQYSRLCEEEPDFQNTISINSQSDKMPISLREVHVAQKPKMYVL